jgi:chemotaxis protein CheX
MEYKNIIKEAVVDIFSSMVLLDIETIEGVESGPMEGPMLSGMIGLAGDLQGSVLIHLPATVAIAITNAFLGLEINSVDDDVKDAVGELTNMVAGGVKFLIPGPGQDIELAIPSVVCGQSYSCEATGRFERTSVLFELAAGRFVVEMQIKVASSMPRG